MGGGCFVSPIHNLIFLPQNPFLERVFFFLFGSYSELLHYKENLTIWFVLFVRYLPAAKKSLEQVCFASIYGVPFWLILGKKIMFTKNVHDLLSMKSIAKKNDQ